MSHLQRWLVYWTACPNGFEGVMSGYELYEALYKPVHSLTPYGFALRKNDKVRSCTKYQYKRNY